MNDLLQLKGTFEQKKNSAGFSSRNIPNNKFITIGHLKKLAYELKEISSFWKKQNIIQGALLSIEYNGITAKSNRVKGFLSKGKVTSNNSIVGAKFTNDGKRHVITHFIDLTLLDETINFLDISINIAKKQFKEAITYDDIAEIHKKSPKFEEISKSRFVDYLVDSYYVNKFLIDRTVDENNEVSIVTIYDTKTNTVELMEKLGIKISHGNMIGSMTIRLHPNDLSLLKQKAPYLISMTTIDIANLTKEDFITSDKKEDIIIPKPKAEPVIGVIDTMFNDSVYFSDWVEFTNMLDKNIELSDEDYKHGTSVSSIIVDGPSLNPELDDGCGRFRVRHFGVAKGKQFSSFTILKLIREIITTNKDIKVWNLSLGSDLEINKNSISPEAAILDEIQYENDVIFIIAGTNNKTPEKVKRLGAPADSINSLVVNSVSFDNKPASYTRIGPVLSFFNKPDVSYYGGDSIKRIKVCAPFGIAYVEGTSFAAPWITRKVAYLVYVLGLNREIAKALLIDAASGWDNTNQLLFKIGYGIVPKRIEDVVKSKDDEIKFILYSSSEQYNTYNYNIPVPISNDKYPYIARATLCYFPYCSRNQGVDYTSTEFNMKFGRVKETGLISINNDVQDNPDSYVDEETAREHNRKWDNVKHIRESYTGRNRGKSVYKNKMWGISITSKERIQEKYGKGLNFGIVVTMKEINGTNRIEDFIKQCAIQSWLVNRINVKQRVDIYNIAEENIILK